MDLNVMDKLRLLKIDTELRPDIKMKPMSRYYFATPTNPGEQFFVFASTAAWLIRKCGKDMEQPHEEDDPNSIIASIIDVLREQEITERIFERWNELNTDSSQYHAIYQFYNRIGTAIDFSSHKLKQGSGEQVCYILNVLADEALKKHDFEWQKPLIDIPEDKSTNEDTEQIEDETEIILDDDLEAYSEESDEEFGEEGAREKPTIVKSHDWEAWKLELERVTPALRLKIAADGRDWRARQSQMITYKDDLFERIKTSGTMLNKLHTNISTTMDKVNARENILNGQFGHLIKEYGTLLDELNKITNEQKELNASVNEKQETLNDLTAKLESVKQRTESKGTAMNDNSPLVTAKKALTNLKKDIQDLDFQIIMLLWLLTTKENPNSDNLIGKVDNRIQNVAF